MRLQNADIKQMIMSAMRERIEKVVNFDEVANVIDEYVSEHTDEIAHAVMGSLTRMLELPSSYKNIFKKGVYG